MASKPTPPTPTPPPKPQHQPQESLVDRARQWKVTVLAGSQDREAQLVTVHLPRSPQGKSLHVREPNGAKVVAQMAQPGVLAFRINPLKAGAEASYLVDVDEKPSMTDKIAMQATQNAEAIKLTSNNRPILNYVKRPLGGRKDVPEAAARGGYLHPLYTPAGVLVTDDFPRDKPFQHGVWTTWQKVESAGSHPDFWDLTRGKGRVAVESIGSVWGGPLAAGFDARQYFTDFDQRKGMTVLRESWEISAFRPADRYTIVDLHSAQTAINGSTILGVNPFGGILVRGSRDWQAGTSVFMTSEGTNRETASGTTARWCYLGGKSGGRQAGIAVLAHPSNPKSEAVFIDPVDPVMGFAQTPQAPLTLQPSAVLRLMYRYVLLDGPPDSKLFDKLWSDFANPPEPRVQVLKFE